ncbi:hypothetical protein O181_077412 [Austropuccinia psidii MF-1]|uniref:Uncharacterized protein n=1 Tax=Austropuccinia psidii MF-1 TaxID=1389203 RepID=A0A9Q3FFY0_9BASI|nr:hypothetical protein [Austropuccinia psidii MF-1]
MAKRTPGPKLAKNHVLATFQPLASGSHQRPPAQPQKDFPSDKENNSPSPMYLSACYSKPEHKHDSQIPQINGIAKIPPKHGAESNQLKRDQSEKEPHQFPNTQLPPS